MRAAKPRTGSSRRMARTPWSEKEVSQLVALWGMNLSKAEIASRLNQGEAAVAVKASRINLPPRNLNQKVGPQARAKLPPLLPSLPLLRLRQQDLRSLQGDPGLAAWKRRLRPDSGYLSHGRDTRIPRRQLAHSETAGRVRGVGEVQERGEGALPDRPGDRGLLRREAYDHGLGIALSHFLGRFARRRSDFRRAAADCRTRSSATLTEAGAGRPAIRFPQAMAG